MKLSKCSSILITLHHCPQIIELSCYTCYNIWCHISHLSLKKDIININDAFYLDNRINNSYFPKTYCGYCLAIGIFFLAHVWHIFEARLYPNKSFTTFYIFYISTIFFFFSRPVVSSLELVCYVCLANTCSYVSWAQIEIERFLYIHVNSQREKVEN